MLMTEFDSETKKKPTVVVLSIIDWDFRFQRPQHMAAGLVGNGWDVYYFDGNFDMHESHTRVIDGVNVVRVKCPQFGDIHMIKSADDIIIFDAVDKYLAEKQIIPDAVIVMYPTWYPVFFGIKEKYGTKIIFDYLDEFDGFHKTSKNPLLLPATTWLKENCDLAIASSQFLFEKVNAAAAKSCLIRNGADCAHFEKASGMTKKARPIVGYYGAIAEWFDFESVAFAAKTLPQYDFILIGEYTQGDAASLALLPNVSFLGEIPYAELPEQIRCMDVCLVPFDASTDLIKATNPVKFYEYLAAGKKIVATAIPELAEFDREFVLLSNDKEEFANHIRLCAEGIDSSASAEERMKMAQSHDWSVRSLAVHEQIMDVFPTVSIVIVTHNCIESAKECISTIFSVSSYPRFDVIVVDNASADGTREYLKIAEENYLNMSVFLSDVNLGFAKANSIAAKKANGEYVIFLNVDTTVKNGWIQSLFGRLNPDSKNSSKPRTVLYPLY